MAQIPSPRLEKRHDAGVDFRVRLERITGHICSTVSTLQTLTFNRESFLWLTAVRSLAFKHPILQV